MKIAATAGRRRSSATISAGGCRPRAMRSPTSRAAPTSMRLYNGLKIERGRLNWTCLKVNASADLKEVGPVYVAPLLSSCGTPRSAAELAKPLVGPNTRVITLQNGVDSYERVSAILGKEGDLPLHRLHRRRARRAGRDAAHLEIRNDAGRPHGRQTEDRQARGVRRGRQGREQHRHRGLYTT